jgi:alpha-1,6-mannosyltransferase
MSRGLLAVGVLLVVLTVLGAIGQWSYEHNFLYATTLIQMPVYAFGVWLLLRGTTTAILEPGRAFFAILVIGVAMRLILLPGPPVSTDAWRYIWDGRVQADGINPYLYLPADAALAHLRDTVVFPEMNRADYAPTIYAPMAQIVFFLVTRLSESMVVMKAAMLAFEAVAVWLLLQLLAHRGLPRTHVLLYAWHPLPVWEFAGSGHVDALAMCFLLLAFVATDRRWPFLAGAALAAGTFIKYLPAATAPALYKRWDWRMPVAFVVTAVLLYLPYLSAGRQLTGFLGGYLADEGMMNGQGIYLWTLLSKIAALPAEASPIYFPIAATVLIALAAVLFFRRAEPGADLAMALVLAVATMVALSPHWPWYFIWLIPLVCVTPMWSVIYLTSAAAYLNFASFPPTVLEQSVLYVPFFGLLAIELFAAARRTTKEVRHGSAVAV